MRVVIAEDGFIRDLLARSFPSYGVTVCGQARTAEELIRLVDVDPPDIITVDIAMPVSDADTDPQLGAGLNAARHVRQHHPGVAILALSQYAEVPWAEEIVGLGTSVGYQLKDRLQELEALVSVMQAVVDGEIRIDSTLIAALVNRKRLNDPVAQLTTRELEVLSLMAEGLSNAAIENRLHLSASTVEGHERSIYQKLGLARMRTDGAGMTRINVRVMAVLAFLRSGRTGPRPLDPR